MGTTLAGTQIRNTYQGILKTSNNTTVGGTLRVISDGEGNESALSLSSTEVKVNALSIENVSSNESLTKMLMWNDSTKNIERRDYDPSGVQSITASTITTPSAGAQIQLDTGATCNFIAGSHIQITGSGSSVTINTSMGDAAEQVNFAMTESTVTSSTSGAAGDFTTSIVHTFTKFDNTTAVSRITGSNGIDISSVSNSDGGRDFTIDAGRAYWRVDRPSNGGNFNTPFSGSTASDEALLSSMDLTDVTAFDLLVVVDVSQINSQLTGSISDRTITLPPPYAGRRIKVMLQPVPSNAAFQQELALPIRFQAANSSTKDDSERTTKFCGRTVLIESNGNNATPNYVVKGVGTSAAKDYIYFQDITSPGVDAANSSTTLGLGIGTTFDLFGIDQNFYQIDARVFAEFNVAVTDNEILQNGS